MNPRETSELVAAGPTGPERAAAVLDPAAPACPLPAPLVAEVFAHVREGYPEESCGLLLGPAGQAPTRIVRCTNVQNARKARGDSELDARRAFWIDERELFTALRDADQRGEALHVVYHSHTDADAYLSHTDVAGALSPDGALLYPGALQLVVSVREGQVCDAVCYEWSAGTGQFCGRMLEQEW